jgi:hypothetical protein
MNPTALISRRAMLRRTGTGLGMLGLYGLLGDTGALASNTMLPDPRNPLAPRPPHFPGRAKHVIHVYLNGGPSQVDTFDPKPLLGRYAGQTLPAGNLTTERPTGAALPSPFRFRRYGHAGLEISELFDRTASRHADDLCLVRSMHANTPNHEQSMRLMNCGDERLSRPSMGAWVTYGLGTENQNLPGFVAMCPGLPVADTSNWRSAFLPGIYQGTHIDTRQTSVERLLENIRSTSVTRDDQRRQLDLLGELNRQHQISRAEDGALEARIQSFELAYRMQAEAAEAFDLTREPAALRQAYGEHVQGRQLLIARRLVERGVRFVQCYHGDVQPWDSHNNIEADHRRLGREIDGALAALLSDLKRLGLFEETLVMIGGEFGRTPAVELVNGQPGGGRDHNHWGFTVCLAGGGIKGGTIYGATDEFGYRAVENLVHVHDLHATILHLLGFDHERLTYRYAGRDFRLTDVEGRVVREILA